ncbi:ATP-dependent DNA helicase MER3 [Didymella sp. IMI 355093]|nr:ATP-dependent DNA helicase MER3 [Didymella sp. IMI 355093]
MSRRRVENAPLQRKKSVASDDFGDADLDDDTLVKASCGDLDFDHIDKFADPMSTVTRSNAAKNKPMKERGRSEASATSNQNDDESAPVQLPNGRWSCNHKCKDKEACKHCCCKNGMDKPPKKAAPKRIPTDEHHDQLSQKSITHKNSEQQIILQLQSLKRKSSAAIEELDLTQQEKKPKTEHVISGPSEYRNLQKLHKNSQKKDIPATLNSVMKKKPAYCYGEGGEHQLPFLSQSTANRPETSSEYGHLQFYDFGAQSSGLQTVLDYSDSLHLINEVPVASRGSDAFGDDDSIFGEAIVGLADSQDLRANNPFTSSMQNNDARDTIEIADDFTDVDFPVDIVFSTTNDASPEQLRHAQHLKTRAPFFEATSSPEQSCYFKIVKSKLKDRELYEPQQGKTAHSPSSYAANDENEDEDVYSDLLNMLDMSLATGDEETRTSVNHPAKVEAQVQSIEVEQEETNQIPESFKDLQPWLFQEFGDIVELVDE